MIKFFDCEIGVGNSGLGYPSTKTPVELLAMMDRYAIDSALVYDRGGHESGVYDRFDFLLDFCAASPRLKPAIPILPPACGEQPPPDELVSFILDKGIKAVRACPAAHNFIFNSFTMGRLLEPLQKRRIPVICTYQQVQDHPWLHEPAWRDVYDVATTFPKLPIVMLYTGMLQGRRLMPLLEACPNVLADLNCASFHYVEYVTEKLGAGRLVYASHYPTEDPGIYTTWVNYAGVSETDRGRIAAGNIRRLVEGIR